MFLHFLTSLLSIFTPTANDDTPPMLYRSVDQGAAWERYDEGLPGGAVPRDIVEQDGDLWLATDSRGVYVLPAGAERWVSRNNGLPTDVFALSLAIDGKEIAVGTYRQGIFVSHDGGLHWQRPILNLRNTAVTSLHFMDGVIVAATDRGIFRSYDGGLGWLGLADDYLEVVDLQEQQGRLFGTRRDGIIVSDDRGVTWETVFTQDRVWDLMAEGDTLYGLLTNGGIVRSLDGGATWEYRPSDAGKPTTGKLSLPQAFWNGYRINTPNDRPARRIYENTRGWFVGVMAGC